MSTELVRRLVAVALLLLLLPLQAGAARDNGRVVVVVEGVEGELLDNVRASLSIARDRKRLTAVSIQERHGKAQREIERALQPFGYYRVQVEATLDEPASPERAWWARYRIDAGPPLPVGAVDIRFEGRGADFLDKDAFAGAFPLAAGDILDHRRYEAAKRSLLEEVRRQGYRRAHYRAHRVEVDLERYSARIELVVAPGRQSVIGPITFEQDRFDTAYLERYLVLQPGDPYNSGALSRQRQALSRSGHFSEVEIEPQPPVPGQPGVVPLKIRLQTFPNNRYRGRLGWGTDTGVGTQLDWTRRYVGGRGQHFNLGLALVEERRKLAGDLNYVIPLDPLAGSRLVLGARHESKDLTYQDVGLARGGETRIATNLLSATWHQPRRQWGAFELRSELGVSLVGETYDMFEVLFGYLSKADQEGFIDAIGEETYNTLTPDFEAVVPRARLALRRSDDRLYIRSGDYLDLQLLGADEALGSNISFWQARLDTWHIRSLGERSRLLLRTEMGYSEAESKEALTVNFNQMPEYYEFRAGGVRSVRGYGFETLFPIDTITGGKHELVASLEYEYEVIPDWSVATFVDGGNAFNSWEDYEPKVGVGLGLRWRSPVGLARIDLGVPLDDADDSFQVYITVGPEF
ncbi:autotransporter assembly complex protein TamA [Parahaliea mediterranea]|uniref:Translocation and assembly module subunit TamA n=1 Tax=Parahaliea mediterranea TaxID=651086 RepID=A0A939DH98_9GAMM|nr:BamA/TamA family outer membrane protein [Parahaliea mediterranea]MBN7797831.1 BamA/TamA family outer membrane protein [Parahaliea mediterranea]